jgi:hypothetical protein
MGLRVEAPDPAPSPPFAPHQDRLEPVASFQAPRFLTERPHWSRRWVWVVVLVVALAAGAIYGLRFVNFSALIPGGSTDPIALAVMERDGQLQIEWNRQSRAVTSAVRGTLEIMDGKVPRTVALSPSDLSRGRFTYERQTGDIEVRLSAENSAGSKTQEASRFLGRPPQRVDASEVEALREKRAQLEAEISRLRGQSNQQAARIQQLERTLRILQARLGIDAGKK